MRAKHTLGALLESLFKPFLDAILRSSHVSYSRKVISSVAAIAYASLRMEPEKLPPAHYRPKFHVRFSPLTTTVTFLSAVIGLVLFLFPGVAGLDSVPRLRIAAVVLLVLVASVSLIFPWLKGVLRAVYGRINAYPRLHQRASRDSDALSAVRLGAMELMWSMPPGIEDGDELQVEARLAAMQERLTNLKRGVFVWGLAVLSEVTFRVRRAGIDKGRLVVVLEDPESVLHRGDKLVVLDTEDLFEMGTYEVIDVLANECYAAGGADTDPLWKGNLMEHGEMNVVPNRLAVLVKRGGDND